jgi:hypothetical protein
VDAGDGAFASISVFETQASLDEADRLIDRWAAAREVRALPPTVQLTKGEVVAQKGI